MLVIFDLIGEFSNPYLVFNIFILPDNILAAIDISGIFDTPTPKAVALDTELAKVFIVRSKSFIKDIVDSALATCSLVPLLAKPSCILGAFIIK